MKNIVEEYGAAVLYLLAGLLAGGSFGKILAIVSAF